MAEALRFDGRVVVITGAGQGLGRSHALSFAARGARVVVNDLGSSANGQGQSEKAADVVVEAIREKGGTAIASHHSVEQGDQIIQTALTAFGRVDVLVNNAGILRDVSFAKMTHEDWARIFAVHVDGAFRCTHAAWSAMREQGYGRVLVTTSAAGLYGNFGQANYSAAKLALVGLAQTLALEGEKRGILVNAVAPLAASRLTETVMPAELLEGLKPEYVTPLVLWLAHERCTTTGGIFEVGGGFFSQLRWQRTKGKTFAIGRDITPEQLEGAWDVIQSFEDATAPRSVTEALGPVVENLSRRSRGGNEWIDVDQALGFALPEVKSSYTEKDVALYALGVGSAKDPLSQKELKLVYEAAADGFTPLPTFAVIPAINVLFARALEGTSAPGLNYGFDRVLHGEQVLELTRPLPAAATLVHRARISEIWDKGKNAVVVTHIDSYDEQSGELLARNDISTVVRGAGGWGGERGPGEVIEPPPRDPDLTVVEATSPAQALLYRLSGDINPLHADPEFARMFGFERPILHGLCTYGIVARAVLMAVCEGDVRYFRRFKARFADPVVPGETIAIDVWKRTPTELVLRARVVERNTVCLSNAVLELYPELPTGKRPAAAAAPPPAPAQGSATQASFAAIAEHVKAHPELVTQVGVVYQFKLTAPDSEWVLDLKNAPGAVRAGTVEKPDCTLSMADADWQAMSRGKADPQKLFTTGKLKIAGNVMASQKLAFLTKLRLEGSEAAAAAPPQPSAPATFAAPGILAALKARVAANPALARELDAVLSIEVKDSGVAFTLDFAGGAARIIDGASPSAPSRLTLSDAALVQLTRGASPQVLFQHGELKVDGELAPAHRLGVLRNLL